MDGKENSNDVQEIMGEIEIGSTIPDLDSADVDKASISPDKQEVQDVDITFMKLKPDLEDVDKTNFMPDDAQTKVHSLNLSNEKAEILVGSDKVGSVSSISWPKSSEKNDETDFSLPKDSTHKIQKPEAKRPFVKSVSFMVEEEAESHDFDEISKPSSSRVSTDSQILQNNGYQLVSVPSCSSSKSLSSICKRISPTKLEDIPEADEQVSEDDYEVPGYYGWDGYEGKFVESIKGYESWSSIPKCIPPWAKSVRQRYGVSSIVSLDEDREAERKQTLQDKIGNLMKKHKDLILLKRVESKKQLIVQPNEDHDELDTVRMRAKSTRYYMTPLILDEAQKANKTKKSIEAKKSIEIKQSIASKKSADSNFERNDQVSFASITNASDSLSFSKKTSRPQAKKDVSQVLKSLQNTVLKTKGEIRDHDFKEKKEPDKCAKITLSNIREFVNMSPKEKKLHEIIKIEKVPSIQDLKERAIPASKYIINVPESKITDKSTLNVIRIKEKRKLRVDSVEKIEEKITELHYNQDGTKGKGKIGRDNSFRDSSETEQRGQIKTKSKSPTETKTFEVISKQTPIVEPLITDKDKQMEKLLLIQYDKKSKQKSSQDGKRTTQLLGIKEPCTGEQGEMYLYGSETEGKNMKENLAKVQDIPPTLKDKVHLIFEELRGLTFQADMTSSEVQVSPTVDTKTTQRPSDTQADTEEAMVKALPEVKSAAVQVQLSQILAGAKSDSFNIGTPPPTPASDFLGEKEKTQSDFNKNVLNEKLKDLAAEEGLQREDISIDHQHQEQMKKDLLEEALIEKDKAKEIGKDEKDKKPEVRESVDKTTKRDDLKKEQEKTKIDDETKEDEIVKGTENQQTELEEETEKSDEKEIAEEKEKTEEKEEAEKEALKGKGSEIEENITKSKELIPKHSQTGIDQEKSSENELQLDKIEDGSQPSLTKDHKTRKPSRTSSIISGKKPTLTSAKEKDFEETDNKKLVRTSTASDKNKQSMTISEIEMSDIINKRKFPGTSEDIRSYELDPQQGAELVIKSSTKFLHKKEALRKRMNWTDDTIFLENNTCPQLIRGLAETAFRQPADPIAFLANWIYKDCENKEREEQEAVRHEHLQLARTMQEIANGGGGDKESRKKFNIKKYPIEALVKEEESSEPLDHLEEGKFTENHLENQLQEA